MFFEGEVLCIDPMLPNYYMYTFRIHDLFHGNEVTNEVEVFSGPPMSGSCSADFELNEVYYVFAHENDEGLLKTGKCTHNFKREHIHEKQRQILTDFKESRGMASWKDVQDTRVARGVVLSQKPDGKWVFYHQDGTIAITAEYNKGLRNCTWKYYLSKRHSLMTFEDSNASSHVLKNMSKESWYGMKSIITL